MLPTPSNCQGNVKSHILKKFRAKKVTVTFMSKKFRCANCCQILKKHFLIKWIDLATLFQKRCHYVLPPQIKMTAFKNKVPKSKDIVDDIKDQPFAIRLSFAREADSVWKSVMGEDLSECLPLASSDIMPGISLLSMASSSSSSIG